MPFPGFLCFYSPSGTPCNLTVTFPVVLRRALWWVWSTTLIFTPVRYHRLQCGVEPAYNQAPIAQAVGCRSCPESKRRHLNNFQNYGLTSPSCLRRRLGMGALPRAHVYHHQRQLGARYRSIPKVWQGSRPERLVRKSHGCAPCCGVGLKHSGAQPTPGCGEDWRGLSVSTAPLSQVLVRGCLELSLRERQSLLFH